MKETDSKKTEYEEPVTEGPGTSMTDDEIQNAVLRFNSETGSEDELVELLIWKYPGLTKIRVYNVIYSLQIDRKL